jgi:anti-sigma factor RsiW
VSCQPETITGYVDGALDEATRADVEAHLATCEACRSQVAAENELRGQLRALPSIEPRPGFEQKLRRRLQRERPQRLRFLLPIAAALVVSLLWGRGTAGFVAWELARDHGHCFGFKELPAQVWSGDAAVVTAWFGARGRAIPLVPEKVGGLELVGARQCPLIDRRVGHLYYVGDDRRVSLFVVPGSVRFAGSFGATPRRLTVRLIRVSGSIVGIVGERTDDVDAFEAAFRTTVASADLAGPPS